MLEELLNSLYLGRLKSMTTQEFITVWNAVHVIKPSIHPDNAFDKSGPVQTPSHRVSPVFAPFYLRSGWPVYLLPIAEEALLRYRNGEITAVQYYFQEGVTDHAISCLDEVISAD